MRAFFEDRWHVHSLLLWIFHSHRPGNTCDHRSRCRHRRDHLDNETEVTRRDRSCLRFVWPGRCLRDPQGIRAVFSSIWTSLGADTVGAASPRSNSPSRAGNGGSRMNGERHQEQNLCPACKENPLDDWALDCTLCHSRVCALCGWQHRCPQCELTVTICIPCSTSIPLGAPVFLRESGILAPSVPARLACRQCDVYLEDIPKCKHYRPPALCEVCRDHICPLCRKRTTDYGQRCHFCGRFVCLYCNRGYYCSVEGQFGQYHDRFPVCSECEHRMSEYYCRACGGPMVFWLAP